MSEKNAKKRLRKMPMPNKNWTENAGKKNSWLREVF